MPPVVPPARVVRAIVRTIEHPRRQRTVGWFGRLLELEHAVMPGVFNRLVPKVMDVAALGERPAPKGPDNVFESMPQLNRVDGGVRSTGTRVAIGAAVGGVLAAAAGALTVRSGRR